MRRRLVVAVLFLMTMPLLGSCGAAVSPKTAVETTTAPSTVQVASSLAALQQRPLHGPAAVSNCPSSAPQQDLHVVLAAGLEPGKPATGPNYGFGDGPVYLSGQETFYPGAWDLALWLVKPPFVGPLLIRGQQVGGPARASFSQQLDGFARPTAQPPRSQSTAVPGYGTSAAFYDELDLSAAARPPHWAAYFADTHFDAAGCYFLQVDGTTFSELILLEVPDAARPPA